MFDELAHDSNWKNLETFIVEHIASVNETAGQNMYDDAFNAYVKGDTARLEQVRKRAYI